MQPDNRRFPRSAFVELITLLVPGKKVYIARSEDVSLGGMFLVTDEVMEPDTNGFLVINIRDHPDRSEISSKFKVVHNRPSASGSKGLGVAFTEMSDEDKQILFDIMSAGENYSEA